MKILFLIVAILVSLYLTGKDILRDARPTTDCSVQEVAARQQLLASANTAPASAYTYTIG
ncbi:hypothetical protein C8N40_101369 [Pontibacter mucosus]|uniref:Uncharacterized protein n=1 Tax=Pontibacter mucosus TaxID=1649266 RepID=A0A2T5YTA8_9BACT|nr:hypothetical protein [Pontibacter mucosus]PTX22543.1 hypothetical protein C8N40_101369 [Pontibacter mucosus]